MELVMNIHAQMQLLSPPPGHRRMNYFVLAGALFLLVILNTGHYNKSNHTETNIIFL
ncbi:hypothetical protein ACIQVE_10805 [Pseudomonas sp. NPDC098747]|uniref:hypothetical protein n=1 Tax=Pseudomonas sp. NPDC098747 TaxID=3364487 RepID=UPI00383AFF6E